MQTVVNNRTHLLSREKQAGPYQPSFTGPEGAVSTLSHSSLHNSLASGAPGY